MVILYLQTIFLFNLVWVSILKKICFLPMTEMVCLVKFLLSCYQLNFYLVHSQWVFEPFFYLFVFRPLWMDFPTEKKTFNIDDEYMFGKCFFFVLSVNSQFVWMCNKQCRSEECKCLAESNSDIVITIFFICVFILTRILLKVIFKHRSKEKR